MSQIYLIKLGFQLSPFLTFVEINVKKGATRGRVSAYGDEWLLYTYTTPLSHVEARTVPLALLGQRRSICLNMVWGVALVSTKCTKPSTYMIRELEEIRKKLTQVLGSDISPVEGGPKEVCINSGTYSNGIICFGYTAKYDVGEWSVSVCTKAKISLTIRWGDAEKTIGMDECGSISYKELVEHKGSLDIYRKANKILSCAL